MVGEQFQEENEAIIVVTDVPFIEIDVDDHIDILSAFAGERALITMTDNASHSTGTSNYIKDLYNRYCELRILDEALFPASESLFLFHEIDQILLRD
jgi:hypothetical protein